MAFRGRGGGSRGRGRGGGRGRGRGSFRGRGRSFVNSRVEEAPADNSENEAAPSESESEEDFSSENEQPALKPYQALIQSLNTGREEEPPRKRQRTGAKRELVSEKAEAELDAAVEDRDEDSDEAADSDDEPADEGARDPFAAHFQPDETLLEQSLKCIKQEEYSVERKILGTNLRRTRHTPRISRKQGQLPAEVKDLKLKRRIADTAVKSLQSLNQLETSLMQSVFRYEDILLTANSARHRARIEKLVCLHAVNHIFKTRDQILKNTAKLSKESEADLDLRDQGYTRPKVLLILPTRQACARVMDMISEFAAPEQQENKKRFQDDFTGPDNAYVEGKPSDFKELFQGNDDDMFRIGLKFTRKTLKFFSPFYSSDIILASPLGLKMAIGEEGSGKVDYDFLSSIELISVFRADALLMQNWEHLEKIFASLNLEPKEAHGCDFSRVRAWCLDGHSKNLRQTIITSEFNTPEISSLAKLALKNVEGKIHISESYEGAITGIDFKCKQSFIILHPKSPIDDPDIRFEYFKTSIFPTITSSIRKASRSGSSSSSSLGLLIYVPSYLDFIPLRNYFAQSIDALHVSFGAISEYTSVPEVARARSHFMSGKHSILLYSERAHHFRRYAIRGVKRVLFYGLPENPIFYKEVVGGFLGRSVAEGNLDLEKDGEVRALFSVWDKMKLERIVGSERVDAVTRRKSGDVIDFV